MDSLAGRGEYGIGDRRTHRGDAWLADAGWRLRRWHDVNFNFRHLVHAQDAITVEVVLLDMAVLERNRAIQRCPQPEANSAFHLCGDDVGIDGRTAVDRAHDPIDLDVACIIDADLGNLGNESLERLGNRDAAALALWTGGARPAGLLGSQFQHALHAGLMLEELAAERKGVYACGLRHLVDERLDGKSGVRAADDTPPQHRYRALGGRQFDRDVGYGVGNGR